MDNAAILRDLERRVSDLEAWRRAIGRFEPFRRAPGPVPIVHRPTAQART